jgi:beta-1,2-mannosidase
MKMIQKSYKFLGLLVFLLGCRSQPETSEQSASVSDWALLPFVKTDDANPVLIPDAGTRFFCPIRRQNVAWEEKDVYNPATVVRQGKIYMIYRAEDTVKAVGGTSRLGLAESEDGLHFKRLPEPVFYPAADEMKEYEWMGGCEDPRIVEDSSGTYFMTYTAYDGKTARLCMAVSRDLLKWEKKGLVFKEKKYQDLWSKSGSVVCRMMQGRMVAAKIQDRYWMYWGENGFLASSTDLLNWQMVTDEKGEPRPVIPRREGQSYFDNALVEPGPPALLTDKGILLIYNGASYRKKPAEGIENYCGGQAVMDKNDPSRLLARLNEPFIFPEKDYEITGQVNRVVFVEGLAYFQKRWFLYYGTADSKIAVAVCEKSASQ